MLTFSCIAERREDLERKAVLRFAIGPIGLYEARAHPVNVGSRKGSGPRQARRHSLVHRHLLCRMQARTLQVKS